jgi:hypothetical protein
MRQRQQANQYNTSFSHYFVPVNFLSYSSSLCCFVKKSIRVDLTRQGSQFRVNTQPMTRPPDMVWSTSLHQTEREAAN